MPWVTSVLQLQAQAARRSKDPAGQAKWQRKSGSREEKKNKVHTAEVEMADLEEKYTRKRRKLKHDIIDEESGERIVPQFTGRGLTSL